MLVSCVAFGVMWMVIRVASRTVHPFEIVFFRNLFGLLALTPMLLRTPSLIDPARALPNLRRAASGVFATLGTFYAVASASTSDGARRSRSASSVCSSLSAPARCR
jgi:drug/metabolite transporter (DMT)-like permease